MNADDGRGENQGVARRMEARRSSNPMKSNKSTHTFATPYNARFGMPFADQLGKGAKVIKPVLRILDVSSAGKNRIITLSAQVRRIDRHGGQGVLQVASKRIPVAGSPGYPMKTHDYRCGGVTIRGQPFSVGKP